MLFADIAFTLADGRPARIQIAPLGKGFVRNVWHASACVTSSRVGERSARMTIAAMRDMMDAGEATGCLLEAVGAGASSL